MKKKSNTIRKFSRTYTPVDPCVRFLATKFDVGQIGVDVPFEKRLTFNKQLMREFGVTQEERELYNYAMKFGDNLGRAGLERVGKTREYIYRELRVARNNAMNSAKSVDIYFDKATKDYIPSRKKLHDRIVKELLDSGDIAVNGQANVMFTGGYSGSGKGRMTERLLKGRKEKYVHLDSDLIKERLAHADGLLKVRWEAPLYHDEASVILKRVQSEAMRLNKNILYDGTLNGTTKALKYADDLIARGYNLEIGYAKVSLQEAIQRTTLRYFEKTGGRLVDPLMVLKQGMNPLKTLELLKPKANKWSVYDTSGKNILNPKLISKGGEGFLTPDLLDKVAKGLVKNANSAEAGITRVMKEITKETKAHLTGLQFKLKTQTSTVRKLGKELAENREWGVTELIQKDAHDSVRYTMVTTPSKYNLMVDDALRIVQERGYKVTQVKNFWGEAGNGTYKGINIVAKTPQGVKFELQFHTNQSILVKERQSHALYEKIRKVGLPEVEIDKLKKELLDTWKGVTQPKGVQALGEKVIVESDFKKFIAQRDNLPLKLKPYVTQHTEFAYEQKGAKFYQAVNGKSGYVVTNDGELISVFSQAGEHQGMALVADAIKNGATRLDCFDGYLTGMYEKLGFRVTKTLPWVDKYAPVGWDYEAFGRPNIVYMRLKKTP